MNVELDHSSLIGLISKLSQGVPFILMLMIRMTIGSSLSAIWLVAAAPAAAASCESLTSLTLPDTTITLAQPVAAGEFTAPAGAANALGAPAPFKSLPAFCRVAATLKPTSDSDIKIEVWMPASD